MKNLIFLIFLIFAIGLSAQNNSATIREQMAKIRQSTNWDDPVAAKKANEQIHELSKKLMITGKPQGELPKNLSKEGTEQAKEDVVDYKMKMWGQIMKSASGGEGADILLAEPIREEIKNEYKNDESPKIKNNQYFEEVTFLCLDMSLPTIQRTIDQMKNFKSIKTLVITGGKNGAPVDLEDLFSRAAKYPLKELYIINFRNFTTEIPRTIGNFTHLGCLALYNNHISSLPPEMSSLTALRLLYIDMNPIATLAPGIELMNKLDTLGIAKTNIGSAEVARIKQQLPNCKILLQ